MPGEGHGASCRQHRRKDAKLPIAKIQGFAGCSCTSICDGAGCGTEAKYNMPGEAHGAFCGQHKMKDMERVNTRRCSADGCDKRASFNDPGAPAYPLPSDLTVFAVHF